MLRTKFYLNLKHALIIHVLLLRKSKNTRNNLLKHRADLYIKIFIELKLSINSIPASLLVSIFNIHFLLADFHILNVLH